MGTARVTMAKDRKAKSIRGDLTSPVNRARKRRMIVISAAMVCAYAALYPFARKVFIQDYSGGGTMIFLNTSFVIDTAVFIAYSPLLEFERRALGMRVIAMEGCRCHRPLGSIAF